MDDQTVFQTRLIDARCRIAETSQYPILYVLKDFSCLNVNVLLTLDAVTAAQLESNSDILFGRFYVDSTSPSGLRMKIDNAARNPKVIRKSGDVAGYKNQDGYWEIGIQKVYLKVHRIVWILLNGSIPNGILVDHKDGNGLNNLPSNLQLLTNAQNTRALNGPYASNTSGFLGVYSRPNNSWFSLMRRNQKPYYLGTFSTPIAAAKAYNNAVTKWAHEHGETPRYLNPV